MTTTLLEQKLIREYKQEQQRHKEVVQLYKDSKGILPLLSPTLKNKDWWRLHKVDSTHWELETFLLTKEDAQQYLDDIPYRFIPSFVAYNNRWKYAATLVKDGITIKIIVDGGDKPENCQVIEHREMKEVITYESICEPIEENKEIK